MNAFVVASSNEDDPKFGALQVWTSRRSRHEVFGSSGLGRSLAVERSIARVLQEAGPREAPDLPKLGWLSSLLLCHLAQRATSNP